MNYNLIFYLSKKTSYCERALKKAVKSSPHKITDATNPVALGEEVTHSLKICPLTVIVGGLTSNGDDNLAVVLSRVFSTSGLTLENIRSMQSKKGAKGYIIRYKSQIILALPDSPDDIAYMCNEELMSYIEEKISVKAEDKAE